MKKMFSVYGLGALLSLSCLGAGLILEYNVPFCRDRFRSIDGTNFVDLYPLFFFLTNNDAPGPRPLTDWVSMEGVIADISTRGQGIIARVAIPSSTKEKETIHITGYPHESDVVDGDPIRILARRVGRKQYRTVGGGIATVSAYDYGILPTIEQHEAFFNHAQARLGDRADVAANIKQQKTAEAEARILSAEKELAAKGYPTAQYNLAKRYLEGRGVDRDPSEAQRLLKLAAAQGHAPAKQKLEAIEKDLAHK